MAIVSKKSQMVGQVKSQSNLQKLLLPSEFHPHGRVKLDPETNMPEMPKRNVLHKTIIKKSGRAIEIEVNGGHALAKNSVWRAALAGPTRYIWKMLRDELKFRMEGPDRRGRRPSSVPTLMYEETNEARLFVAYIIAEAQESRGVLPDDFLNPKYDHGLRDKFAAIDEGFYEWLKTQEKDLPLPKLTEVYQFLPA